MYVLVLVKFENVLGKWCEEEIAKTGEGGIDIDSQAGFVEAHVLATPVPSHLTCLKYGNVMGGSSFPCLDEESCCTQTAPNVH